jgi:hypothetical protein
MPGTVFQYWRVTFPLAGVQEAADALSDGADDEQPARATRVAAAETAARRVRVTVLLMFSVPEND